MPKKKYNCNEKHTENKCNKVRHGGIMDELKINHKDQAKKNFMEGYNCAQAVFLAFSDEYNLDSDTILRISSSFGGGMGRLREVCGAVTGMFMAAGMIFGYTNPKDQKQKSEHYTRVQYLAKRFEEKNESIICRELLGIQKKRDTPVPEERTKEYYKKRPCFELVSMAAEILDKYIIEQREEKVWQDQQNGEK